MSEDILSVKEIVDTLKKTSLITVLVEGKDDAVVYRHLNDKINIDDIEVDVLQCGGRVKLLNIFKRRQEFKNAKVIFLADKDMWVFGDVPEEYKNIVFTDGYSIENDLYIESHFNNLLNEEKTTDLHNLIKCLSVWFAFEVNKYKKTGNCQAKYSVGQICPNNILCSEFKNRINFIDPPEELINEIYSEYTKKLRGKQLFDALVKFVSSDKKEKEIRQDLIKMGAKLDNPKIEKLVKKVVEKLQEYG
jgi:hypothetical protein